MNLLEARREKACCCLLMFFLRSRRFISWGIGTAHSTYRFDKDLLYHTQIKGSFKIGNILPSSHSGSYL